MLKSDRKPVQTTILVVNAEIRQETSLSNSFVVIAEIRKKTSLSNYFSCQC